MIRLIYRWAATVIGRDGLRKLARPNQSHLHFDWFEDAQDWVDAINRFTPRSTQAQVWGRPAVGTMRVDRIVCYQLGDAVGIYWDPEVEGLSYEQMAVVWSERRECPPPIEVEQTEQATP